MPPLCDSSNTALRPALFSNMCVDASVCVCVCVCVALPVSLSLAHKASNNHSPSRSPILFAKNVCRYFLHSLLSGDCFVIRRLKSKHAWCRIRVVRGLHSGYGVPSRRSQSSQGYAQAGGKDAAGAAAHCDDGEAFWNFVIVLLNFGKD